MRRVAGSKIKPSPTPNCAGGRGSGGRCENKSSIGAYSKLAHLDDAGRRGEDKPDWRPCCAAKTWSRRYFQRALIFFGKTVLFRFMLCSGAMQRTSSAQCFQDRTATSGLCRGMLKHSVTCTHEARALTMWGHSPNSSRMCRRVVYLLRMPITVVSADAHAPASTSHDSSWGGF